MKSLELFLLTTPQHITLFPTIVILHSEGGWAIVFEWMGVAIGVESR